MSDHGVELLTLVVAAAALLVAILTYAREGKWKDSEGAKDMAKSITDHGKRLTALETEQKSLATKADIASLQAEFHGLEQIVTREVEAIQRSVQSTDAAIIRVEQFLMSGGSK